MQAWSQQLRPSFVATYYLPLATSCLKELSSWPNPYKKNQYIQRSLMQEDYFRSLPCGPGSWLRNVFQTNRLGWGEWPLGRHLWLAEDQPNRRTQDVGTWGPKRLANHMLEVSLLTAGRYTTDWVHFAKREQKHSKYCTPTPSQGVS